MRFANRGIFFGIALFFLVGGLALVAIGSSSSITGLIDANSTPDSDPAGAVLPLIGGIWAGVAALLLVIGGLIVVSGRRDRGLVEGGQRAPARIDAVETTGVVLNNVNVGVRVSVTVMPPGGREFPATIKTYVPTHGLPQAGDVALVAYDPAELDRITFVADARNSVGGGKTLVAPDGRPLWQARAAPAPRAEAPASQRETGDEPTIVEQLERLNALREKGVLTDAEFHAQKYRILTSS